MSLPSSSRVVIRSPACKNRAERIAFAFRMFCHSPIATALLPSLEDLSSEVILGAIVKKSFQYAGADATPAEANRSRFQYITSGSMMNGSASEPCGVKKSDPSSTNELVNVACENVLYGMGNTLSANEEASSCETKKRSGAAPLAIASRSSAW